MQLSVVERTGFLVVQARGLLSPRTAPELRDCLLKAAAEQPRGIVCDLSGARATREGLTVLHVVADQVADWPSAPVALVATDDGLLAQLERLGLHWRLPIVADLEHASAALRHSPRLLRAARQFPPTVDAPAAARAFVSDVLTRWRAEDVVQPARSVVSELVTNAVVHARTEVTVRASLAGRRVGIAVGDRGAGAVRPGANGGWGLRVVEQLSRTWGVLPRLGDGVVVWAVLGTAASMSIVLPQQAVERA